MSQKPDTTEKRENSDPNDGMEVKRLILEDMGIDPKKIDRLNSRADLDAAIEYYTKKAKNEKPDGKAPMLKLNANMGQSPHETSPLPAPEDVKKKNEQDPMKRLNARLNPLDPINGVRRNTDARLAFVFDESGNPRLF
jgi:hypothetical protein